MVAEEVFRRYGPRWKPRTQAVNRRYLDGKIMPFFGEMVISEILRQHVAQWMASLRAQPASANRSLPVLSVIMRESEAYGYRPPGTNPCRGVRRYREASRERFLRDDEYARLGYALHVCRDRFPQACGIVRLLALTGCRSSEIRELRWADYRDGEIYLRDSKTGPRTVYLSRAARMELRDVRPAALRGEWVFPGPGGGGPLPANSLSNGWAHIRAEAGLGDVRMHDLRHSFATLALRLATPLPTISRLLGHGDPDTTLRYTHFLNAQERQAVDMIGRRIKI